MLPWFAGLPLTCSNRPMCGRPASMRHSEIVRSGYRDRRLPALFTEAAPLQPWLDVQAALAGRRVEPLHGIAAARRRRMDRIGKHAEAEPSGKSRSFPQQQPWYARLKRGKSGYRHVFAPLHTADAI